MMYAKRRFGPVGLMVKGEDCPFLNWKWDPQLPGFAWKDGANIAVCLPVDERCDVAFLSELDECLNALIQRGEAFRAVSEEFLTEEWGGVDRLIVFPHRMGATGKRKLLGFEATGGEIVCYEKLIGAEGFEPPTHCSQSSCASQTALCSD